MSVNKEVLTRAPVRICDIGGWTDTWFYPEGAVFNFFKRKKKVWKKLIVLTLFSVA